MIFFSLLRSLIMLAVYPFMVVIFVVPVVFFSSIKKWNTANYFIQIWAYLSLKMFGVQVHVIGHTPKENPSRLFIFNHTSFYDIFAIQYIIPWVRFGAKEELFSIPFFSSAMRAAGVLMIARANREETLRTYEATLEKTSKGRSFALSPEGTRTLGTLGKFKSGPFIFAIRARIPIVPVIVRGANNVLPKNEYIPNWRHWKTTITLEFLDQIPTEGFKIDERHDLQKICFDQMQARLMDGK